MTGLQLDLVMAPVPTGHNFILGKKSRHGLDHKIANECADKHSCQNIICLT